MSYFIEQEIKSLVSQANFTLLLNHFHLTMTDYITQRNTYYDTIEQDLKHHYAALRLRNFANKSEWTYKQIQDEYRSLELTYHQSHLQIPAPTILTITDIPDTVIADQLTNIISSDTVLTPFLEIQTDRWNVLLPTGEIALDRTYYGDTVDYEIEFETDDLTIGKTFFQELLLTLDIPFTPADKKIARALRHLSA